jgi:hypothetical protein
VSEKNKKPTPMKWKVRAGLPRVDGRWAVEEELVE